MSTSRMHRRLFEGRHLVDIRMNEKVFTSTTAWKPENVIFKQCINFILNCNLTFTELLIFLQYNYVGPTVAIQALKAAD